MYVEFPTYHSTVSQRLYVFSCSFTSNISGTRIGMFMIYLCIKFHLSNCTYLLVLRSNEKLDKILHGCHIIILHYQKYYLKKLRIHWTQRHVPATPLRKPGNSLKKVTYFFKVYYHMSFLRQNVCCTGVAPAAKLFSSAMCLFISDGNLKYGVEAYSSIIIFIRSCVQIKCF